MSHLVRSSRRFSSSWLASSRRFQRKYRLKSLRQKSVSVLPGSEESPAMFVCRCSSIEAAKQHDNAQQRGDGWQVAVVGKWQKICNCCTSSGSGARKYVQQYTLTLEVHHSSDSIISQLLHADVAFPPAHKTTVCRYTPPAAKYHNSFPT